MSEQEFNNPFANEEFNDPFSNQEFNDPSNLLMDDYNPFEKPELVNIDGLEYWKKKNDFINVVELWNEYYSQYYTTYGYNEIPYAGFDNTNNIGYYPNLGIKVKDYFEKNKINFNCKDICTILQDKLIKQGYFHTDLYNGSLYNCNNVVFNKHTIPCPIDFIKMRKLETIIADKMKIEDLQSNGIQSIYFSELSTHIGGNKYYNKYLKYKKKYLRLKNFLN